MNEGDVAYCLHQVIYLSVGRGNGVLAVIRKAQKASFL